MTQNVLATSLKQTLDEKVAVIDKWIEEKKLEYVNGYHLFFSIWAMTTALCSQILIFRGEID